MKFSNGIVLSLESLDFRGDLFFFFGLKYPKRVEKAVCQFSMFLEITINVERVLLSVAVRFF